MLVINNTEKKKTRKSTERELRIARLIIGVTMSVLCLIVVIIAWRRGRSHIDLRDYVSVSYTGANGYAQGEGVIDKDGLREFFDKREYEDDKKVESFLDSLEATVTYDLDKCPNGLSNTDRAFVTVGFDSELISDMGFSCGNTSYTVKVSGVKEAEVVDLFADVTVTFAGLSPEAAVLIENNSADEFLRGLKYSASKVENIAVGDEVIVSCEVSELELGRQGLAAQVYERVYRADKLSRLVENKDEIDMSVIDEYVAGCKEAITDIVSDKTTRVMYMATKDEDYLHMLNEETVTNIKLEDISFIEAKDKQLNGYGNAVFIVYKSKVTIDKSSKNLYFGFKLKDCYIKSDNSFNIAVDDIKASYVVSDDEDKLLELAMPEVSGNKKEYDFYDILSSNS